MKTVLSIYLSFVFTLVCAAKTYADEIVLRGQVNIYMDAEPGSAIDRAVQALKRDFKKTIGAEVAIKPTSAIDRSGVVIVGAGTKNMLPKTVSGWESHSVYVRNLNNFPQVILEGADVRGTIYAIYTFSEKILGVPPLWYFSSWNPVIRDGISIDTKTNLQIASPEVKYRAWFPNDTDLFEPWRARNRDNYELWLEAALRLKVNTIEWHDNERDYSKPYNVSRTTKLINDYGLTNTTHHHSPLNASFAGWNDYWKIVRQTEVPELLLANEKALEEFWRYNVETVVKNKIDMLWVIGFRGNGDHPFWYSFKDAPESMFERGAVINRMLQKQREIVIEVTGKPNTQFRTIFYDELSDMLAQGFIKPPADSGFIWTYVAARRDHYPNKDIQQLDKSRNYKLGYYFNYQFTSTGSHLAAGEGPWKMEQNYRYVASKSSQPLAFSVVNAGNIREFVMELSANARMMWDTKTYSTDSFLHDYCTTYFGKRYASRVKNLYKKYYNSYWQQKKPDLEGIDRQYIFQDLRYKRAITDLARAFNNEITDNPFTDIPADQEKGRTYRIVPSDNRAATAIDAVINGTSRSAKQFAKVSKKEDAMYKKLDANKKTFFNDNLRAPANYMWHLNECVLTLSTAYKEKNPSLRSALLKRSISSFRQAEQILKSTEHGRFKTWYEGDRIFGLQQVYENLIAIDQAN